MVTTPNYGGELPTNDADEDTWGIENNALHLLWDSTIKQVSDTALSLPRSYLAGLTLATAGSSSVFSVAIGQCRDSTDTVRIDLATAMTKTTGAWAVGSSNGSLDSGTIANSTWYHAFLIRRPDTGVVDVLTSLSPTAPTLPASYTQFRRIGSMKTNGSAQWTGFSQLGDEFIWREATVDATALSVSTTAVAITLSVPTGLKVIALGQTRWAGGSSGAVYAGIYSPDETTPTMGTGAAQGYWAAGDQDAFGFQTRTNTLGQVNAQTTQASCIVSVNTNGWIDRRGRDD